jgi:hypothetical protein
MNKPDSMAKNMPKIAEVELSRCGFKVANLKKKLRLRNCGVAVAEQHFLKSCGIAIVEVLPSSCGIANADSRKVARAHLCCFQGIGSRGFLSFVIQINSLI